MYHHKRTASIRCLHPEQQIQGDKDCIYHSHNNNKTNEGLLTGNKTASHSSSMFTHSAGSGVLVKSNIRCAEWNLMFGPWHGPLT